MIRKLTALSLFIFMPGCTTTPEPYDMYGPDYYTVECRDGEVWIVSEHGEFKLEGECENLDESSD